MKFMSMQNDKLLPAMFNILVPQFQLLIPQFQPCVLKV
jgi:hypothetical protein